MSEFKATNIKNIESDLSWIEMLKGLAIIGVFFDNWVIYFKLDFPVWGPFVQVFFILSGFGLALTYLKGQAHWNWKQWTWRRITKIFVPYVIIVIFSFMLGILGSYLYPSINKQFSWAALLAYLTLTRNFFPTTWGWNVPLWFMPVIIGLYISFPVLLKVLQKWGEWVLLVISFLITWGSITVVLLFFRRTGGHQSDLFLYWMIQFSLGIVLAYIREVNPKQLQNLIGLRAFLLGIGLFFFSWVLRTYVPFGKVYNDIFTSVGIFFILLNLCWTGRLLVPVTEKVLSALGNHSYLMYLVHYPIIVFLIGPLLKGLNGIILSVLAGIYLIVIFCLCCFVSQPINKFTSWLYGLFFPVYQRPLASHPNLQEG